VIHGAADGASAPETSANKEGYFSGVYQRHVLPDVGHFPQRECPDLLAKHILEFLRENC
jgi:pimeloyl-ACP methyl ester carboxylesterase